MAYTDKPEDLISRLRRIENELADLRRRSGLSSATIRRGGLRLLDDAFLEVVSADGDRVAKIGALGEFPNGSAQQGTDLRYQNGNLALTIWNPSAADPDDDQFTAVWNDNTPVMATDPVGSGLARPWLAIPLQPAQPTVPAIASAFVSVLDAFSAAQHPATGARVRVIAPAGTAAEGRLLVNGAQIGAAVVLTAADSVTDREVTGLHGQPFGTLAHVEYQLRRTSGAGTVDGCCWAWWRGSEGTGL